MSMLTTIPAKAGTTRVDGIDVNQLLQAIGEASASASAVDLFGLLLVAQRVLIAGGTSIDADEAALLASARAMNGAGRNRLAGVAKQMQKRFPHQRATLTLVHPHQRGGE